LEFTHNNQRHADRPKTSFKIIQGESPKALPLTYKNTKFPSIDDKIKQKMADRDEAWPPMNWLEQEWQTGDETHSPHSPLDKKSGWIPEI
jgi:hypothetical protein